MLKCQDVATDQRERGSKAPCLGRARAGRPSWLSPMCYAAPGIHLSVERPAWEAGCEPCLNAGHGLEGRRQRVGRSGRGRFVGPHSARCG